MGFLVKSRLSYLIGLVRTEEDFIKAAMRLYHWRMRPEIRQLAREYLSNFYQENH
jgi:hypothetical protein